MTGYSHKSLKEKLGLKDTMASAILAAPKGYEDVLHQPFSTTLTDNLDFIQYFSRSRQQIAQDFPHIKQSLKKTGMLWISWPKSSCSFASTDLTENTVRSIGLSEGLVDVKVIAVDENWSGLKFVYRLKDR